MSKVKPDAAASLSRRSAHRPAASDAVLAAVQEVPVRALHCKIPAALHRRLKQAALDQNREMTEIVVEALEASLGA